MWWNSDRRGFTLLEVLVAAGIFVIFAAMAFQIILQVTRYSGRAKDEVSAYLRAARASELLIRDLKQALSGDREMLGDVPAARFFAGPEVSGNYVLAFVRSFGRGPERGRYLVETSGTEFFDTLDDDGDGIPDNHLQPTDGFAEVVYFVRNRTLYRAFRSPMTGSMQDLISPSKAEEVCNGVLRFALRFWGPETRAWDAPRGTGSPEGNERLYALRVWDSTRGLGDVFKGFPYTKDAASLHDPSDDIFPRMVEVTLMMDAGKGRSAVVTVPAGADDGVLETGTTDGLPAPDVFPYLLAGGEWLKYTGLGRRNITVERGVWGTTRAPIPKGRRLRWGYPVRFRVFVPAGRDAPDIEKAASFGKVRR